MADLFDRIAPEPGSPFETPLTPAEEAQFQAWKLRNAPLDSGADYDLRGAFKAGLQPGPDGHWADTFKKPNHPLFSDESIYAGAAPERAGHWNNGSLEPPIAKTTVSEGDIFDRIAPAGPPAPPPPPPVPDTGPLIAAPLQAAGDIFDQITGATNPGRAVVGGLEAGGAIASQLGQFAAENVVPGYLGLYDLARGEGLDAAAERIRAAQAATPDLTYHPHTPEGQAADAANKALLEAGGQLGGHVGKFIQEEVAGNPNPLGVELAPYAGAAADIATQFAVPAAAGHYGARALGMVPPTAGDIFDRVTARVGDIFDRVSPAEGPEGAYTLGTPNLPPEAPFTDENIRPAGVPRETSPEAPGSTQAPPAAVPPGEPPIAAPAPPSTTVEPPAAPPEIAAPVQIQVGGPEQGRAGWEKLKIPAQELDIEPERFQFKRDVDTQGMHQEMRDARRFNPDLAPEVTVWRDPEDGRLKVINGHNRVGKALESGHTAPIAVAVVPPRIARDAVAARVWGAIENISEGRGTALDAAKIFRDTGMTAADVEGYGVSLSAPNARDGLGIAALADPIYRKVVTAELSEKQGAMIGRELPDHAKQMALFHDLDEPLTDAELRSLIRQSQATFTAPVEQTDMFGGKQAQQSLNVPKAKLATAIETALKKEKRAFSNAGKEAEAELLGSEGNVIQTEANKQRAIGAAQLLQTFDRETRLQGPINDLLNEGARRLARGEDPHVVETQTYAAILEELKNTAGLDQAAVGRVARGGIGGEAPAQGYLPIGTKPAGGGGETPPTTLASLFKSGAEGAPPDTSLRDLFQPRTPAEIEARTDELASRSDVMAHRPPPAPAGAPLSPDKLVRISEIAKELSQTLDVPIRRGRFGQRALGVYKGFGGSPKVIRVRSGGLATIIHEHGHYLDDMLHLSHQTITEPEQASLLREYGAPVQGRLAELEAFAEYIRFFVTEHAKATRYAPQFDASFKQWLETPAGTPIQTVLYRAAGHWRDFIAQSATARVKSMIRREAPTNPLTQRISDALQRAYQQGVDKLFPLSRFKTELGKSGRELAAHEDPYVLARNLSGVSGVGDAFLEHGTLGLDDKVNGESFDSIVRPVKDKYGQEGLDNLDAYLIARRVIEKAEQGKHSGISPRDAAQSIKEIEAEHPDFPDIAQRIYDYRTRLFEYGFRGRLSDTAMAKIQLMNTQHVPFYRVLEEEQATQGTGLDIAKGMMPKGMKGSELEIYSPLDSTIKDTYAITQSRAKARVIDAMANLSSEDYRAGRLFERVPQSRMVAARVGAEEFLQSLEKQGVEIDPDMREAVVDAIGDLQATIFRTSPYAGRNTVSQLVKGKTRLFEMQPDMYQALRGLNAEDVGLVMRMLGAPARLLRAGATLAPEFFARNPFRDQFTAFVNSKYGYNPLVDLPRGILSLLKRDEPYWETKIAGGLNSTLVSLDRGDLQMHLESLLRNKRETALHMIRHPVDALRVVSALGEEATRLGEARRALKSGASPAEAALAAKEITVDFTRIGAKTRALNTLIAFWNANVQGADRMVRALKDDPVGTSKRIALSITLPSVLLYLANRSDPRYQQLPQWQKDLFWIVPVGDTIWRIPKPFELGVLFGSVPERILEYFDRHDPDALKNVASSVAQALTPGFVPTAGLPVIENITNHSMFLDRPIVPRGEEALPPEEQYGRHTTETARRIGEATGTSPAKLENLVRGYTGGLGRLGLEASDLVVGRRASEGRAPSGTLADVPLLRGFVAREPIGAASASVEKFYQLNARAEALHAKLTQMRRDSPEATNFVQKYRDELRFAPLAAKVRDEFTALRHNADRIRKDPTMSPAEKTKAIDEIERFQTHRAQATVAQFGR